MKELLKNKYVAEYERVSTGNQDLQMQIDANEVYLRNYGESQVLKFQDFDVSATKLTIHERPALTRLLKVMEEGLIKTLVVYDRDRLARNVYEYVYIAKMCYKHDVEVIYTAASAAPFSQDIIQETWYGLFAQMEGKKIQTRLFDVRNRYPQKLIGYSKIETKKGRIYKRDQEAGDIIAQLFQDVSGTVTVESLIDTVIRYGKSLNRDANRIIGILNTPFYSAHGRTVDGNYFKLDHVEQIIPLSLFKTVQGVLRKFGKSYEDIVKNTMKESSIIPICGLCGNQMVFKKGKLGNFGTYTCKQHRKIRISSEDVDLTLRQTAEETLNKINTTKIKEVCRKSIRKHSNTLKQENKHLADKIEQLCVKICANFSPYSDTTLINKPMKDIKSQKEEMFQIEEKINQLDILKREISRVAEYVEYHLENNLSAEEFLELVDLLVGSVEIYSDYIKVNIYFEEFISEGGE